MSALEGGLPAPDVAVLLNEAAGAGVVWCDGGGYDAHWLRALFQAGGLKPGFVLGNWHALLRSLPDASRERAMAVLEAATPRHRAGADAEQLMHALAAGILSSGDPTSTA
ncbi:hypothetical protein ACI7BZ_09280 [Xanthobacter sp. AM11]|uniref:hypothetical protein n=1 Tax=Xanthobacter sp. AM11 TaxID=3380643 RepID=UPI0039BF314B